MTYSDYTLNSIATQFGIGNQRKKLFATVTPITNISERLQYNLQLLEEMTVRSEKAKSELIIMPILLEMRQLNNKFFTIYSGDTLYVDENLKGECDFIIAKDTGSFDINYPIIQVVEAKKNDVEVGIPQCAAQMIGAKKYNEKNGIATVLPLYGCVTTGDDWLFMCLEDKLYIDNRKYYLGNLPELLGVFQQIIDLYK
jgi:hypothetical protein